VGRVSASAARATTVGELQTQLNTVVEAYNHHRPHRSLAHQATPATAYAARPKADPATRTHTHDRVRTDRVDHAGVITLRVAVVVVDTGRQLEDWSSELNCSTASRATA
jgi:hypothetical protein